MVHVVEEAFVHQSSVSLLEVAAQRLGLSGDFGGQRRYLRVFHLGEQGLAQGWWEGL